MNEVQAKAEWDTLLKSWQENFPHCGRLRGRDGAGPDGPGRGAAMSEIVWLFGMLGQRAAARPGVPVARQRKVVPKTLSPPQEEFDSWAELREFDRKLVAHTLENR